MDLFLSLVALLVEACLFIVSAVSRPLKYLLSSTYRQQLRMQWQYTPAMIMLHIFGKLALLILIGVMVVLVGHFVLNPAEPAISPHLLNKDQIDSWLNSQS